MEHELVADGIVPGPSLAKEPLSDEAIFKMPAVPPRKVTGGRGRPKGSFNRPKKVTSRRQNVVESHAAICTCRSCPVHVRFGVRSTKSMISAPFRTTAPPAPSVHHGDIDHWLQYELFTCRCPLCVNVRLRIQDLLPQMAPLINESIMAYNAGVRLTNAAMLHSWNNAVRGGQNGGPVVEQGEDLSLAGRMREKAEEAPAAGPEPAREPQAAAPCNCGRDAEAATGAAAEAATGAEAGAAAGPSSGSATMGPPPAKTRTVNGLEVMDRLLRAMLESPPLSAAGARK